MDGGGARPGFARADALALLALAALWAACFSGVLAGRGLFFERQFVGQFWAMRADAWERLLGAGDLPLWTTRIFMGLPLLAQANWGLLDPLNPLAFAPARGPEALNLLILADWAIALAGAYALGRGIGLGPAAAALGAILMTFTPYALDDAGSLHHAGSRAWAPWCALALARIGERRSLRAAAAAGVLYGFAVLAGGFNYLIGANAVLAAVGLAGLARAFREGRGGRALGLYALAGVLAAGVAAVQLLPTAELLPHTPRGQMQLAESVQGDHHIRIGDQRAAWRELLVPPAAGALPTFEADRLVDPLTAAFFLLGLALAWRNGTARAAGLAGALLYVLALGPETPLYAWMYESGLPGVRYFKMPQKLLHGFYFAAALAAAAGVDRLLNLSDPRAKALFRGLALLCAAGIAGAVGLPALLQGTGVTDSILGRFALLALLSALGSAFLAAGAASPFGKGAAAALLVAVTGFGQLALYGRDAFPLTGREGIQRLTTPGPLVRTVQKEGEASRVFHLGIQRDVEAFPNLWTPFGIEEAGGFASMALERTLAYSFAGPGVWALQQYASPDFLFEDSLRRLAGVRFLVADRRFLKARERTLLGDRIAHPQEVDEPLSLYALDDALPRAFIVGRARSAPDGDAALAAMLEEGFDPASEAIFEGLAEPLGFPETPFAPARVVREGENALRVLLPEPSGGGILVLTETFYPGWRAEAGDGGEPRTILRANSLFRAVVLRPGDRELSFRYDPASFRLGAFLTLAALTASLALALPRRIGHGLGLGPRRDQPGAEDSPPTAVHGFAAANRIKGTNDPSRRRPAASRADRGQE